MLPQGPKEDLLEKCSAANNTMLPQARLSPQQYEVWE